MPVSSSTMRILCMLRRGGGQRRLGNDRQLYDEARSNRLVLLYTNGSVMFFDDTAHDGQAKASSALSGGKIRQKKFFLQLSRYTVASVSDCYFNRIPAG